MSQSRLQNSLSNEQEQGHVSDNQSIDQSPRIGNKSNSRPLGRPRGKGRPKLTQQAINKKKVTKQQFQADLPRAKQRANAVKQDNQIQAYVKIVDFLKKIDCDEASFQNKMNPYHSLTASCFWYMVSAEYYSYDFFLRNNPLDAANHVLNRVSKLPIPMPTRFIKNIHQGLPLQFQTQEVRRYGENLSQHLAHFIPSPLSNNKSQNIQKKLSLTTVTEDNQFIASIRAISFNYVRNKIEKSQKWSASLKGRLDVIQNLQPKQIVRRGPIAFQWTKQQIVDASQLDILSRQVKKKKIELRKNEKLSEPLIQNNQDTEEKVQDQKSKNVKSLSEHIEQKMELEQNQQSEEQKESVQQKKQSNCEQMKRDGSEGQHGQQSQKYKIFMKQMSSDQVLLSSIINLPLEKLISILESTLPKIELPQIYPTFMPIPRSDPLEFVYQLHEEQENYLQYMKQYQKKQYQSKIRKNQQIIDEQQRQIQFQDAKCQICTDGDYTDDNLIVFCSTCNISLHQRCVGLAKVPAQSWVCDVCAAFGPAGINLPCPLCNVKGGAMKRTNIHIDTNLFKQMNPGYYEYSKKCPYNKQKQEYPHPVKVHNDELSNESKQQKQESYYDYFNKTSYPNDQPACHYVWVHYVCSIWVPECYFEQKNGAINVKGIQNIQKKRYKHECYVCKKVKAGACVKCQDQQCKKYYHPQCARKKKVYMQQLNLQKIKYLIFCEQHEPLKITRQIEYKKKKNRDQIIKFARMIEKYVQTYKIAYFPHKLMKIIPTKSFIQTFEYEERQQQLEKKAEVIRQSDEDFIKQIIIKLSKVKKISVTVVKTQTGFKIADVYQPSRRQMRKCLNKYDDFWHTLQNGENSDQNCKRYERVMKQNFFLKDKMEIFLSGGYLGGAGKQNNNGSQKTKKGRARGRSAKKHVQTLIQQEGCIFCICRKPYQNQMDMIQCQICGQWYHYRCIGFIGDQVDAQSLEFHCMKCMKFQSQEQKRPRLQKCIDFFNSDSLYLNYSPPTPKLMSEEAEEQIKQPIDLQEQSPKPLSEEDQKPVSQGKDQLEPNKDSQQDEKINIVLLQQGKNKQAQISLPNLLLKGGKKSNKSQASLKSVQKTKLSSVHANGSQSISNQINKIEGSKVQITLTQFFGIDQKIEKQQKEKLTTLSNHLSVKQKMEKLEQSIREGEYQSQKK